jgi:cytochrome c oxidase assembly protein Cox11
MLRNEGKLMRKQMDKKRLLVAVVLLVLFAVGTASAQEVCRVLDVNGNLTTDTIRISVSSYNNATGEVSITVSSDSDKPVNATITITVGSTSKSFPVRIEPFMSGLKTLNFGRWSGSNTPKAGISGAKCLQ